MNEQVSEKPTENKVRDSASEFGQQTAKVWTETSTHAKTNHCVAYHMDTHGTSHKSLQTKCKVQSWNYHY